MINPLSNLPSSGLGSGRINVPFGTYLNRHDFEAFYEALRGPATAHGFPLGVVSGGANWAAAQATAAKNPEEIRREAASLLDAPA